jgi:hypothetical protein
MRLVAIPKSLLDEEWPRVRAGLLKVKEATPDDWTTADVYRACASGSAVLFAGMDGPAWLGFLVLKVTPTFHAKRLDIWCAYSSGKTPLMRVFLPKIKELAQQAGASSIGFASARKWAGAAKRLGFQPIQVNYEMPL